MKVWYTNFKVRKTCKTTHREEILLVNKQMERKTLIINQRYIGCLGVLSHTNQFQRLKN